MRVLAEAVLVLNGALVLRRLPLVVAKEVEPARLDASLLKSALVEVRVTTALVEVAAATVQLLAALDVDVDALVVLSLAGIGAGVVLLGALVGLARARVGVSVELERLLAKVALQVVAAN